MSAAMTLLPDFAWTQAEGWYQIDDCDESIGTRWSNDKSGPGKYHPAELLYVPTRR